MGHEDGARSLHLMDTDDQPDLLTINVTAHEVRAPTTHRRTACCTAGSPPLNVEATPEERADAFLFGIEIALWVGTKHYHPRTHELLTTPKQIIECLLAETEVITERDPCVPSPLVHTTSFDAPLKVEGTSKDLARIFSMKMKTALSLGTKYYHPGTGELLTTPKEIVECLLAETEVIFETANESLPTSPLTFVVMVNAPVGFVRDPESSISALI